MLDVVEVVVEVVSKPVRVPAAGIVTTIVPTACALYIKDTKYDTVVEPPRLYVTAFEVVT